MPLGNRLQIQLLIHSNYDRTNQILRNQSRNLHWICLLQINLRQLSMRSLRHPPHLCWYRWLTFLWWIQTNRKLDHPLWQNVPKRTNHLRHPHQQNLPKKHHQHQSINLSVMIYPLNLYLNQTQLKIYITLCHNISLHSSVIASPI